MKEVLIRFVAGVLIGSLLGCGGTGGPTFPTLEDPREIWLQAQVWEQCEKLGLEDVTLVMSEDSWIVETAIPPREAACWATPGARHITCWVEVLGYSDWLLVEYAKHECCHLSGIWNERAAMACGSTLWAPSAQTMVQ